MNTDGNMDAISRRMAEAEARDEKRDAEQELHDLRYEVAALAAKLADADALIEAQQKDYASNNVRFAESEHRAKAAEAKLAEAEAERDAIERQFCQMSDDYSAVHVALEAAEAALVAAYNENERLREMLASKPTSA